MAIHSAISKTKIEIQDVISPYSLDQFLISSTPQTWKRVKKRKKSNDTSIVVSRQFDLSRKSKGEFPFVKNIEFLEEKRRSHRMRQFIVIDGPDEAFFDRNVAIKSHPFDCNWKGEMHPRRACEEVRRFIAFVGSSSDGYGESKCRQVSRQNRHLNHNLKHVLDR